MVAETTTVPHPDQFGHAESERKRKFEAAVKEAMGYSEKYSGKCMECCFFVFSKFPWKTNCSFNGWQKQMPVKMTAHCDHFANEIHARQIIGNNDNETTNG